MGRKKLDISDDQVYQLAKLGASNVDIAKALNCAESTIRGRFCEIVAKGKADRKNRLRELQWKSAEKGNVNMQIWLGKQELGQSDKLETRSEIRTAIDRDEQDAMLSTEETLDLACNLDQAIIRARRLAITPGAPRDDPGRLRPSRQ